MMLFSLGKWLLMLQRTVVPPSSTVKRSMKAVQFFEKSVNTHPIT